LALCGDASRIGEAAEIYRRAYAINSSPGTVQGVLHQLDALRKSDRTGLLEGLSAVLGEWTTAGHPSPEEPPLPHNDETGGGGKHVRLRPSGLGRRAGAALRPRSLLRTPGSRPGTVGS
jgi:hypothetical protein